MANIHGNPEKPVSILDFLELRMMEVVSGNNWSYKTCKAPVKSSPAINQHNFLQAGCSPRG